MKIEIVHFFSLFATFLQFMRMLTRLIHLKIKTIKNHHKQNTPPGCSLLWCESNAFI